MTSYILSIPEELIVKIFELCDIQSLGRLSSTCKKFRYLIYTEDSCWRDKSTSVLGSNMHASQMQKRSKPILSFRRRCEVSKRWRNGQCQKRAIVTYSKCLPWLCLDQNDLFCSKEKVILKLPRRTNGKVSFNQIIRQTPHTDDVSKFVINGSEVVTVSWDGMLGRWRKENLDPVHRPVVAHISEVQDVDAIGDIIVTGSKDSFVKIWKASPRNVVCTKTINMEVRVLSVAIMPSIRHYIVGLPGVNDKHPLQLFDFEINQPIACLGGATFRNGAGIMDIYPESEHTFLCCGYDTTVKLWDIRTPLRYVASWMDPFDNGIYCVTSDHNVTIVSGASRHSIVHIWDKRRTGCQAIQHFQKYDSPAYSVAFDASHLFVAYDRAVMQFSYLLCS